MKHTIELEDVATLISDKTVEILDSKYCIDFDKFITEQYSWDQGYLDLINWELILNFKQIKHVQLYSSEAKEFIKSTCVSKYEYLAIVFGAGEPGVIGKFNNVVENLNLLSSHTPWVEFLVGAKKNKYGVFELINEHFIEVWTGKCSMTAPDIK